MPSYTQARSHSLRLGRYSEAGRSYLLTTVTHHRLPLFNDLRNGRLLVHEMRRCEQEGLVDSLAWVVMPDHLHWLLTLNSGTLGQMMKRLKARSSLALKRRQSSSGSIWQPGFHDHALHRDEDLQAAARYIVANPLRAGLVKRIGDYPLWDAIWLENGYEG